MEPLRLRRGKAFQELVRQDFEAHSKHEDVHFERRVSFDELPRVRKRSGRMDIFIDGMGDGDIAIYEIKATDWDRIKPKNRRRNLYRHWRQLIEYVEKFVEVDGFSVSLGIIYPEPPRTPGLREYVEETVEKYGACAYWFTEVRGGV